MINYFLLGILAPLSLNLIHLLIGMYVVIKQGSMVSLGFTGISFVTKSMAMMFFLWLGIMFLAGFTPLPFKVFTITSGIISFNIVVFFFICLFTRGLRFFLVAYFTSLFGSKFGEFIEKKGALWFTIAGITIVIIATILYLLFK